VICSAVVWSDQWSSIGQWCQEQFMYTEVKKPGEHIPPSNTLTGKAT